MRATRSTCSICCATPAWSGSALPQPRRQRLLWIQEFESEATLDQYLVSERRRELVHETESHYPGGGAADL